MSQPAEETPINQVEIKKRSRVPGVMITQYVKELPRGKTTPDFTRKPIALTVQEGKVATFKAVVNGDPAPTVTWTRNKGDTSDPEKYKPRYDERNREHILEIPSAQVDQGDTYKCLATNEFGQAVCTATLSIFSVGFKKKQVDKSSNKDGETNDPEDFRKMLKKTKIIKKRKEKPKKEGEIDPKFWEVMLSAKKCDYERICREFGITDFRWMLKQLNIKKKEKEAEQAKDGEMLDYGTGSDDSCKHNMKKSGDKYLFCINSLDLNDGGLYQVDVDDVNIMSTTLEVPDVEFYGNLQDTKVVEGQDAIFECTFSGPVQQVTWCVNDNSVEHGDKYSISFSEDKLTHMLVVKNCKQEDKGVYTAIAGIKSSRATLNVSEDPDNKGRGQDGTDDKAGTQSMGTDGRGGRLNTCLKATDGQEGLGLGTGKDGAGADGGKNGKGSEIGSSRGADEMLFASGLSDKNALRGKPAELVCKLNTDKFNGVWYKDGQKLTSEDGVIITKDGCTHKLTIQSCKDSDAGLYQFEVNDCKTEARVRVGDLPEFDLDALKKFSTPVIVKAGQSASFKMSFPPQAAMEIKWFKKGSELHDGGSVKVLKESNHSRLQIKDCLRTDTGEIKIQLKNDFGSIEALSSLIVLDKPGPPQGPVEVNDSTSALELKWNPPKDDGGSPVTNYLIEQQQVGQGTWNKVGDILANNLNFRDRTVTLGKRYIYRIYAENLEGISEALETNKIMAGSLKFPGPPAPPKVVSAFKNCINLTWTAPEKDGGSKILGYLLEKRKKDTNQWVSLNAEPEVSEGSEYEFRLIAVNIFGPGEPSAPSETVCAKNPNMKPRFKDPEDFIVVRSGNSIRIKVNYEASPPPDITWLKNGEPVSPWNKIIHEDGACTLIIPNSKYSDNGVYTIVAKNSSGQASFDIEVRVTDEPKPPGPVELEQVVYGKVIIRWVPSPDHDRDDRLYYMVEEQNSNYRIWRTIADRLLCTTYTTSIQPGREYHFRVYAKNDMGLSDPSDSPTWGVNCNKAQLTPSTKPTMVTLQKPPSILVPLKLHNPPKGYQCYMTCAVRGSPRPFIAWYHNGISINSDSNYYFTNAFGVCSMYILRVRPEDSGEYKVVAVNSLGKAECSSTLKVKAPTRLFTDKSITPKMPKPAEGTGVALRKRSRVPGVMITQYVEELPPGCTTPDFLRKPIALTIQEGKLAFFKAVVTGCPTPKVSWGRNKGEISNSPKYVTRYDEKIGFKKRKPAPKSDPDEFRKMLKKTVVKRKEEQFKEGEIDPRFWEVLLSAARKDYERICFEYGVTDFRWMLRKLNQKKKEREAAQSKYVENVDSMKQIEVKTDGTAEFELDMKLKDPNSKILLYKDGEMLEYGDGSDDTTKHNMQKFGETYLFSIRDVGPEDAGLYQVDVEDANMFSTGLSLPDVEFKRSLNDIKVVEGQDAVFECTLSDPVPQITWCANDVSVEQGDKYDITVSEDKQVHKLAVKNCKKKDRGVYTAIAGLRSSQGTLTVEDHEVHHKEDSDALARLLAEEKDRQQKELDEAARKAKAERDAADQKAQAKQDDAATQAKEEQDDASRKAASKVQEDKDKVARRAHPKQEEPVVTLKEEVQTNGRESNLGNETDHGNQGKGDGLYKNGSGGDDSSDKRKKRSRGELVPNDITDPGVHFLKGLTDTTANIGDTAELWCKLSSEESIGIWYKDGKKLESTEGISLVKDGAYHKLIIQNCQEGEAGKYKFEAEGRKSEASLTIEDPPRIDVDALGKFSEPVIVKAGENASFKLPFSGKEPIKIQWFREDEELMEGHGIRIEKSSMHSRLLLNKCQRKNTGVIKIKLKNEFATIEATSRLIVLDRPTPPQGPVEIVESSLSAIEFKWRPPKDDGGCPVTNYTLQRQQLGRNTWYKIGDIPGQPSYRDTNIDRGRKYCYRIQAKNSEGLSDVMTTNDIAAGTLAFPGSPAPPKIISAFKDCINLSWLPPSNTGGGSIVGYNVEKRKKGSNLWSQANPTDEPIREKKYAVKDVIEGVEYEFRVAAINTCGPGEPSGPSECITAMDPKKPPGKVKDLKLTGSSYTSLSLSWNKPSEIKGEEDEAKAYFVEIRPSDQLEWSRCNTNAVIQTSFTIVGLKSMAMYWVRVIAANEGGEGLPQGFDNYIIAMPPAVKPKFTDKKLKSFMVVKAGNTASPLPAITWQKDGFPVTKHVTITNFEKGSQLLIYTSELSDTGIYTVTVKNMVGQDTFAIEIRVTDDPKPPGPIELQQNVHGTVTLSWTPSPDEKRDDHLHYMVMKRDSVKQTWRTVVDRLFNNKCTVINILPGRQYNFRVFAKNDLGLSEPSVSPVWGTTKKREKFTYVMPESKPLDFRTAPRFIVPLKLHAAPKGYECYMSCAVTGNPTPHITWYYNNVSLNTDPNYYISNVCGVCSLLILRVGPTNMGEYRVVAENLLGHDESATQLTVKE
ncbi:hypothetical protein DNTS_015301 [Danionella cerebrum]|uniref:Immunoglobulin-like and fibronectin type III domain-containing protein 1 n=1 Tax=Danionella cerebrum TaxID=2873325 RepID=A0A553QHF2_9TELE|nr:hypothetical protein DNTS_015301 [Danionella translucida]